MLWSSLGPRFCSKASCMCRLPVIHLGIRTSHVARRIGSLKNQFLEFMKILTRRIPRIWRARMTWTMIASKASNLLIQHFQSAVTITHRTPYLASSSSLELRFLARSTLLYHTKTVNMSFCIIFAIKTGSHTYNHIYIYIYYTFIYTFIYTSYIIQI